MSKKRNKGVVPMTKPVEKAVYLNSDQKAYYEVIQQDLMAARAVILQAVDNLCGRIINLTLERLARKSGINIDEELWEWNSRKMCFIQVPEKPTPPENKPAGTQLSLPGTSEPPKPPDTK